MEKNTVPQECYEEFGQDLDGCITQSEMGCSRCICYKEGRVRLEKFEND